MIEQICSSFISLPLYRASGSPQAGSVTRGAGRPENCGQHCLLWIGKKISLIYLGSHDRIKLVIEKIYLSIDIDVSAAFQTTHLFREHIMRIYLDNCCFNRILDDRSYSQIYYERNSVLLILELVEQSIIRLIGSEMLVKEMSDVTDPYKCSVLAMLYGLCSEEIKVTPAILDRAEEIRHSCNIKYKDSIHLACAEAAKVDALLTTDRRLISNCNHIKTYTRVLNPNQWLVEVLYS